MTRFLAYPIIILISVIVSRLYIRDTTLKKLQRLEFIKESEEQLLRRYVEKQRLDLRLNERDIVYLQNSVVLVTGAGGTIGSELARQLSSINVRRLVLVDINENSLYDLKRELKERFNVDSPAVSFELANVRDRERIHALFAQHTPNVVFHYANYKSLALGNISPSEFITVNIGGTRNVLNAASISPSISRFIYISSDKAEDASQTYGRTKRIAEMLVRRCAHKNPTIHFCSLRYCNILDAAGSFAIPTFRDQIAAGRKVTIRRLEDGSIPDRYFIPISLAAKLAIRVGAEARNGNIFSLDDERIAPLQIDDLARLLARKSGVSDVESWFRRNVDMVPAERGEKRSESLGKGLPLQSSPLIEVTPTRIRNPAEFERALNTLIDGCDQQTMDDETCSSTLESILRAHNVPTTEVDAYKAVMAGDEFE